MNWEDLKNIKAVVTAPLHHAMERSEAVTLFVFDALNRYYSGSQGQTAEEDQAANLAELAAGFGRVVTLWKTPEALGLSDDLFIITYFDKDHPGDIDYNNTTVMFCSDY